MQCLQRFYLNCVAETDAKTCQSLNLNLVHVFLDTAKILLVHNYSSAFSGKFMLLLSEPQIRWGIQRYFSYF